MYFSVLLLVLSAAVIVFFSDEFAQFIKKLFKIRSFSLLFPLFVASWLIVSYEPWVRFLLLYFHWLLDTAVRALAYLLPFKFASVLLSQFIILSIFTVLPIILFDWFYKKRNHQPYDYIWYLFILLFIILSLILLVPKLVYP